MINEEAEAQCPSPIHHRSTLLEFLLLSVGLEGGWMLILECLLVFVFLAGGLMLIPVIVREPKSRRTVYTYDDKTGFWKLR